MILSGWTETYAFGINNYNEVVGFGNDGAADKAFIYSGGSYTALISPGWTESYAYDIINNGDIVGLGEGKDFLYS